MMNLWNETGAKILPRQQRKPSPAWFDLSAEILLPAIEEKRKLTKDFYRKGGDKTKEKLVEMRRKVAGLVDAAKIRWLEKKVEEMENKFDPRGAWKAMREISNMYAGHVKSSVTVRMRKEDGTMAATEAENGEVFQKHFDGVFNAPATAQDGIEEVIEQHEVAAALGELPSKDEIDYAIARAACEKSPGVDGVPIEAYKIIRESDELFEVFHRSYNSIGYW